VEGFSECGSELTSFIDAGQFWSGCTTGSRLSSAHLYRVS
jgi:hypothetical protein